MLFGHLPTTEPLGDWFDWWSSNSEMEFKLRIMLYEHKHTHLFNWWNDWEQPTRSETTEPNHAQSFIHVLPVRHSKTLKNTNISLELVCFAKLSARYNQKYFPIYFLFCFELHNVHLGTPRIMCQLSTVTHTSSAIIETSECIYIGISNLHL